MAENPTQKSSKKSQATLILTVGLLVVFAFIFLIVFVITSTSAGNDTPTIITADTYRAEVMVALEGADPALGEELITEHTCNVCHVLGDGTVAPLFTGIASRAGEIRPPLDAEQYLYEAIVYPGIHVLDGYTNSMPNNYDEVMTEQEIGHVIAYLMTLEE